jgi:hypothetical protein
MPNAGLLVFGDRWNAGTRSRCLRQELDKVAVLLHSVNNGTAITTLKMQSPGNDIFGGVDPRLVVRHFYAIPELRTI